MKKKKLLVGFLIIIISLIISAQLIAKYYLGFGTPPLYRLDSEIGYLLKPNQNLFRFGNHFITNEYGMRSENFPKHKKIKTELRILVVGDSVLNGGNFTDQNSLATTILQKHLTNKLNTKVTVANISTGGWNITNQYFYLLKNGFFNADIIYFILPNEKNRKIRKINNINPYFFPAHPPPFALYEIIFRYIPRIINSHFPDLFTTVTISDSTDIEYYSHSSNYYLNNTLKLAKENVKHVVVFQYYSKNDLLKKDDNQLSELGKTCQQLSIHYISLKNVYQKDIKNAKNPYRDNFLHLSDSGMKMLANKLYKVTIDFLNPQKNN